MLRVHRAGYLWVAVTMRLDLNRLVPVGEFRTADCQSAAWSVLHDVTDSPTSIWGVSRRTVPAEWNIAC